MSTEFELFPGKNLGGLFKDIYDNQQTKKLRISELIAEMKKLIRHSGDMAVMGPIIRDLIDSSIKNDDSLVKMAAIAQRIIGAQHKAEGDVGFLSDDEKEQLLKQLEDTVYEVADEQDIKVDDLTNEIEELKLKVGK
jgi:hypothetical protein